MKTSVGKTKLEIASGDITQLEVDALVTPAGSELWMDHGVAAAVKRAGGEAVEKEAVLQGPVAIGEAVITTGHDLTARWVVHVALTEAGPHADAAGIAKATCAALAAAERCHARSVAIPAFGTGGGGFPLYQCAGIMLTETVAYLKERGKRTALRHIMFSVYDDAARAAFKNAMAAISRI
jgi:O-acetyl-ADP-ribose deacetylase (regulator of RNase III)